jgi:outer membrane protein TolC
VGSNRVTVEQAPTPVNTANPSTPSNPALIELPEVIRPHVGGMTADQAAALAVRGSLAVGAARAGVRVAEMQQAEAGWAMLPNFSASFRYTRLSEITPGTIPAFNTPGCLANIMQCMTNPQSFTQNVVLQQPILNNFLFRVSLTIPVTDLPLRLYRFYEAAGLQAEARRLDLETQRATAALQARESFYEYVRALGALAASEQALELTRRRRRDIAQFVEVGTLARVELLAVESAVAGAELRVTQTRNLVSLMELQLRQRTRLGATDSITIGEAIDGEVSAMPSLSAMVETALRDRAEIRSLQRQMDALGINRSATQTGWFPSVAIAGNVDISNPNQRIFPSREEFIPTWDLSVQATWSPNTFATTFASVQRIDAQTQQLQAQLAQLRDGLETEVRAQWNAYTGAVASLSAARAALSAAEETYRIRRERLGAGASTQTEVADAENQLFAARIGLVNSYVDLRLAIARLKRASAGRDSIANP